MRHLNDSEIEAARENQYAWSSGENEDRPATEEEVAEAIALEEQMSRAYRFIHRPPWGFR